MATNNNKPTNPPTPPSNNFSSIESLFSEAFQLFKKIFLRVLLFMLLIFGISLILFIVDVILFLLLGASLLTFNASHLLPVLLGGPLLIVLIISIIAAIVISLLYQAGVMLIISNPDKETIGSAFKKAYKYVLPLWALGLLVGLLVIPTCFLFVIPGIIISVLFAFVSYELVLGNRGVIGSMQRSVYVVKTNFWSIFGRIFLFGILSWVIFIPFSFLGIISKDLNILVSFLTLPLRFLMAFYGLCYSMVLYKQAENAISDKDKTSSLKPIVAVWLISLIFVALMIFSVFKLVTSDAFQSAFKSLNQTPTMQEQVTPMPQEPTETPAPTLAPTSAVPALPSCTNLNIREGKFASNKCYDATTLADLRYYLDRYDSVVFDLNGANDDSKITCNGSAFFAAQCDQDKKTISDDQAKLDSYTTIIQGLIAKGN